MKASQVKSNLMRTLIPIKQPTFLWGSPGVGKSEIVKQVAAELNLKLIDVRAVLLDPVDLRGLPHVNGDNLAHWCAPDFLPRQGDGILFLDELNAAPPLVQAACYQLVLDRKLGEYRLPDGWSIVAAGNRETDRAVTSRMPSPLANRFIHLTFDVDLDDWCKWALSHNVLTEIIAFLRFRPALLFAFDPSKMDKAFPTPRSWEFVSKILATQPDKASEYELLSGTVGNGAAAELLAFLKICRTLPNPDMILMQPDKAPIPSDPATLYAISTALARKASDASMDAIVKYANRMPDEFSVLMITTAMQQAPQIVNTRAFIDWASKHSNVMM
jgi:MoxR-like ATPase